MTLGKSLHKAPLKKKRMVRGKIEPNVVMIVYVMDVQTFFFFMFLVIKRISVFNFCSKNYLDKKLFKKCGGRGGYSELSSAFLT